MDFWGSETCLSTLPGIEPQVAHPEGRSFESGKSQKLIRKLRSRALIWKPQNKLGNRETVAQNSTKVDIQQTVFKYSDTSANE